jgi:hypothetical protein
MYANALNAQVYSLRPAAYQQEVLMLHSEQNSMAIGGTTDALLAVTLVALRALNHH